MDIARAQELKSSLIWSSVVEEMDKKIHYENMKFRTCSAGELSLIQARISIWESLKRLPDDVIDREE